jgi:gluconokinase
LSNALILALDIGTSSVRASLYDHAGNLLPDTLVKHERLLDATEDGGAEIDADLAVEQVMAAIDDVLSKAESIENDISHVAVTAFWHSLVGLDAKGKPTTKVLGWADTRSRDYVAKLRKKLNEDEIHNRTGARFHPSYWPAKLLWLRTEQPEIFERTNIWLSFSDYVCLRLLCVATTSVSMASGTGLFDICKCDWDPVLLRSLQLKRSNLPEIVPRDDQTATLNAKYKKRWPRLRNTRWFPVIADGAANNIGSGCVTKNRAALMVGTSGAMRVAYRGEPPEKIPSGLWCYRIDRERVIIGGALSDGGGLYRWLQDNLRLGDTVESEIARRPPDGHGLTFLPFLAGERSTGYHEYATGSILGLKTSTDPADIARAAMEAVAYRFAEIFDQLKPVANIREIVASGGALRESPVWTQIIADVLGRDLTLPLVAEASSHGAVLLALESLGNIGSIENKTIKSVPIFTPDNRSHAVYQIARQRHRRAYDRLLDKD